MMYHGKHAGKGRSGWKRKTLLLVSLVLMGTMALAGTLAYLFTGTEAVDNTFTPAYVTTYVEEKTENGVKSGVKIQNTGDTDAYIRAAVVVTWQDENGYVYGQAPVAGTDYSIVFNTGDQTNPAGKWVKNGGFYYWNASVAPTKATGVLISECKQLIACEDPAYSLVVEIIGSGIQSKGISSTNKKPVVEAWDLDPTTLGQSGT